MTVTLEIPTEIEAALKAKADVFGLSVPDYISSLLETETDDDYSLSAEDIESIQQGLKEFRAGDKGILLEDYRAEVLAAREARRQRLTNVVAA